MDNCAAYNPTSLAYDFVYDYVEDVPWKHNPIFAFSESTETYLRAFAAVVDKIPLRDSKIKFNDDIWNFNPYFEGINDDSLKINFTKLESPVLEYCKFFVLYGIMGKKKISTVNLRMSGFKSVYLHIVEQTNHKSLSLITTDDIIDEIKNRNSSSTGEHNLYESIYQVYLFIINNYQLNLPVDLKKMKLLTIAAKSLSRRTAEKLPNIPEAYYQAINSKALEVMRNSKEEYNTRATACTIVMIAHLGLRLGDLLALRIGQLFTKTLPSGTEVHYIHYKSRKPSKPHDALLEFDIYSDSVCAEAFQTLIKIRKKCELSKGNDYLYVLNHTIHTKDELPIPNYRFNLEYLRFLKNYLPEESVKNWKGITKAKYNINPCKNKYIMLSAPDTRQYRVYVCTDLYNRNVPLTYIQRYMGHLSEYMLGYYVRPKDTYQENITYSEKVIKEIAGDDLKPIGGTMGEELRENIKKAIAEEGLDVATDIEEIVKRFGDKVVIRGKLGGVCIKTSLIPCSKDARSNEILCAYNLCPNLFSFFYMVDISYGDFKTLQQTYEHTKRQGQLRAAEKELHKLKSLCNRRLIQELDELDKELSRKGESVILDKYPNLIDIIEHKSEISEEIALWMKKN